MWRALWTFRLLPIQKLRTLLQHRVNDLPDNKDGYSLLLEGMSVVYSVSKDVLPALKDKGLKLINCAIIEAFQLFMECVGSDSHKFKTMYALLKSKSEQEHKQLLPLLT
ncbi:hypothetical protein PTKIN_Ptkin16aG0530000 [Pterospermum kingtungense]